ncbi:MAG: Hsp20/alpha crystallin family protein [Steroidobacteraceae bacterium]|jgi:HSP20 family molecular chaperone IbpA|nr:Hsp20/alpha crystallin family protein [Steroidobacteraceae bacterium]
MRKQPTWMWAEAFDLLERADRLQRQFFRFERTAAQAPRWEPPVDVVETRDRCRVTVALPGVKAERIELEADEGGGLVVRAVRPAPIDGDTRAIRHLEIPYGRFERRIQLPPGVYELEHHEYIDGCLCVALAKRGERT